MIRITNSDKPAASSLQILLENLIHTAEECAGGKWAAYTKFLNSNETAAINNVIMQSASLIKLFIMGAVYEQYEKISSLHKNIDFLLKQMITVSDNDAANTLTAILGNGNTEKGKKQVNDYCFSNGFNNTQMNRMLMEPVNNGDNYTSVTDCGIFLEKIYNNAFSNSDNMLSLLRQQTLKYKIPAGLPKNVISANKTGELNNTENDSAVIISDNPYIICIMSENTKNRHQAINSIIDISSAVYNYAVQQQ